MTGRRLVQAMVCLGLAMLLVWPTLATLIESWSGEPESTGGRGLIAPMSDDAVVRPIRLAARTAELVGLTELLALPTGILLALLLFRTNVAGRFTLLALFGLMALIPMPLYATAWLGGFGNLGRSQALGSSPLLLGVWGAAFVHAVAALPWIVMVVGLGLISVEPELESAARLEGPAWKVWRDVTLRRSWGAIAGAALAVAVLTSSDMTVTDLLSVRTYAEEAYLQFQIGQGPSSAAAVALPPLVVLGLVLLMGGRILLRKDPRRAISVFRQVRIWNLEGARWPATLLTWLIVGLLVGLPLYSLIWRAGRVGGVAAAGLAPHWSLSGLSGSLGEAWQAIWPPTSRLIRKPLVASLVWSTFAACLSVALAWATAWLARARGVWQWIVVLSLAVSLAVPGPVAGMALAIACRSIPWIYDTPAIVVLALVLRVWSFAFLILWPALRSLPTEYFDAAALDGYSPSALIFRVALPLSRNATILAFSATFLLALGELPASGLVAPPGLTTLPILVWGALHIGVESRLAAIALLLLSGFIVVGMIAAVGWRVLDRRRQGLR